MPTLNNSRLSRPLLLALVLSVTGCAQPSPPCAVVEVEQAKAPKPNPSLMQPAPLPTHSHRAQSDMQTWRESLTGSQSK